MHDNSDAIKALEYLIVEMKADRIRIAHFKSSAPIREKYNKPFQDFKEFEPTGDIYFNFHFVRNDGEKP